MSQENVEIVTRSIDAYNRRDLEALRVLWGPDLEVDWSASRGLEAGVYQGVDAVMRFFAGGFAAFDEIVLEPDAYIDTGDSVVVPNKSHSRGREGIEVFTQSAMVFTVRNSKITRLCLYQEKQEAFKAVGLEE